MDADILNITRRFILYGIAEDTTTLLNTPPDLRRDIIRSISDNLGHYGPRIAATLQFGLLHLMMCIDLGKIKIEQIIPCWEENNKLMKGKDMNFARMWDFSEAESHLGDELCESCTRCNYRSLLNPDTTNKSNLVSAIIECSCRLFPQCCSSWSEKNVLFLREHLITIAKFAQ